MGFSIINPPAIGDPHGKWAPFPWCIPSHGRMTLRRSRLKSPSHPRMERPHPRPRKSSRTGGRRRRAKLSCKQTHPQDMYLWYLWVYIYIYLHWHIFDVCVWVFIYIYVGYILIPCRGWLVYLGYILFMLETYYVCGAGRGFLFTYHCATLWLWTWKSQQHWAGIVSNEERIATTLWWFNIVGVKRQFD